jgi:hypothetical protein
MLTTLPMQAPSAEAARIVTTFDDGSDHKIVEFTSDPLPGERATVYIKVRGDVTVTQAAMNVSAVLLERSWQVGATGLSGLSIGIDISGDLNGDGYTELIVTAPGTNSAQGFIAGLVGRSTGYQLPPQDIGIQGTTNNDWLGYGLSTGADLNKDGYDDLVTSRLEIDPATPAATGSGEVAIWWGGTSINATEDVTISAGNNGDMFGFSLHTVGDVDNDGNPDMVVGAPRHILNTNNPGRAYLFLGSGNSTVTTTPTSTVSGSDNGDAFGTVVNICGDVNGDGYDDVLVGASGHNSSTEFDVGKVYVYHGSSSGIGSTADWTYVGQNEEDLLGFSGSGVGDVNGDGYDDILVGAPLWDNGQTEDAGQALVFYGSNSGLSSSPDVTIKGTSANAALGADVAWAGDINNDTLGDFVIGAPGTNNGSLNSAGHAQVHFGNTGGVNATPSKILRGWSADGDMGISVGPGGDGNGDGYDDIIVGDTTLQFTYVFYGGPDAQDPAMYVDDTEIWSHTGAFPSTVRVDDFTDYLNDYIQDHQGDVDINGDLLVPINISMSRQGRLKLDDVVVQFFKLVQPTGLTATPVPTGSSIKLAWDDHTAKSDDISKMAVEFWNGTGWEEIEKIPKHWKEYIVTDLTDGVQYQFRIRAFDGAVQEYSEASDVAMATPGDSKVPDKILNGMAVEDRDLMGINISWDASDEDTVNYEIYSNKTGAWAFLTNVTSNMTYYVDTDIDDGPWYWYRVRAWDEVPQFGEFSNMFRGRLLDMEGPSTPGNFGITTVPSGRALRLSWDLNDDDTVAYSLESNKTDVWKEIILLGKTVTFYVDTGLTDGVEYFYRLAARDESDNPSNYTAKISGVPVDSEPPEIPTNLEATARPSGNVIRLTWDLNDDDTNAYNVYMFDEGSQSFQLVGTVLSIYNQYDVPSLINSQTYTFRLKAVDGSDHESDWSNEATGIPRDAFPPTIPSGLSFDLDPEGGAVNLTWYDNDDDTIKYRVLQWSGTDWVQIAEVDHPTTWYFVTGLQNDQPYAYVTRAVDDSGNESPNSVRVDVIPKDITAPEPPEFIDLPAMTNERDHLIVGVCQPFAMITVYVNLYPEDPVPCDENGLFSVDVRLKGGPNEIYAEAVDDSGITTASPRRTVRVDTAAPSVDSTDPVGGTKDVTRTNFTFEIYFSEEVDGDSLKAAMVKENLDTTTFYMMVIIGEPAIEPVLVEYDRARSKATFEVQEVLDGGSRYTVLVYDIQDLAGNPLDWLVNGHSFQVWTVESSTGGNGGGGGDDEGLGSLVWIIAIVIVIALVAIIAFFLVSQSGTKEVIEVDRTVFEQPVKEPTLEEQRPDIQSLYSEAYEERSDEDKSHHEVDGGLGDWLAEQQQASQQADEEAKRLMVEMATTDETPVGDSGPIEEIPPGMLPEDEYTPGYHADSPEEAEAETEAEVEEESEEEAGDEAAEEPEEEPEEEADEDDAAALLDELEEELESEDEKED